MPRYPTRGTRTESITPAAGTEHASVTRARIAKRRRAMSPIWLGTVAVVAIVVAALLVGTRSTGRETAATTIAAATHLPVGPVVGDRAPDFTLANLHGKPVSLHTFLGQPVLLHFWAVDCTTCQAEQPDYLKAIHALGVKAPAILAVDAWGESASYVQAYLKKAHLPGTILVDPPQNVFDSLYQGQGTPTSFYIDARGVIRRIVIGPQTYTQILEYSKLINT